MKNVHVIWYLVVMSALTTSSCRNEVNTDSVHMKAEVHRMLDSIPDSRLVAAYGSDGIYSMIIRNSDTIGAIKYDRIPGSPAFADSLLRVNAFEFRSRRYPLSYIINDSLVLEIYHRKIIHPSSNWQGQTPGQEGVITMHPRVDIEQ